MKTEVSWIPSSMGNSRHVLRHGGLLKNILEVWLENQQEEEETERTRRFSWNRKWCSTQKGADSGKGWQEL